MSTRRVPPPPHPDVDAVEWNTLIAGRGDDDVVDAGELAHVLRGVELTADFLSKVKATLKGYGITVAEEDPDVSGPIERKPVARTMTTSADTSDSVKLYLREIGQKPLLTADEERRLGRAIRAMQDAKEQLESGEVLGPVDRRMLTRAVVEGEAALKELITANLRLVVSIARKYDGRELQLMDLVQEGNIGLMRAAEKYDWEKGFKFSTYATWWIRQAMMRAMADQGRTIRIPTHVVELINRLTKAQRDLTVELERDPTVEELAHRAMLDPERVLELRKLSQSIASLDASVSGESDSASLGDLVEDHKSESPLDIAERRQMIAAISEELAGLPERERRILEKRFGIHDGLPRTLDDVAKEEGVTRERIRQIEQKTLARLRHPNNSRRLRAFLDAD